MFTWMSAEECWMYEGFCTNAWDGNGFLVVAFITDFYVKNKLFPFLIFCVLTFVRRKRRQGWFTQLRLFDGY